MAWISDGFGDYEHRPDAYGGSFNGRYGAHHRGLRGFRNRFRRRVPGRSEIALLEGRGITESYRGASSEGGCFVSMMVCLVALVELLLCCRQYCGYRGWINAIGSSRSSCELSVQMHPTAWHRSSFVVCLVRTKYLLMRKYGILKSRFTSTEHIVWLWTSPCELTPSLCI